MKPSTKNWLIIALFVFGIAVLSMIDIGLNIISLIPGIGDAFETASETVIELLQVTLAAFGLIVVSATKK